ncbi:DUF5130 family protein [Salininema proteolyticum]|uniref:DUF5130 family protein n=1 Tax=Salininema proteolyticum TaxID=1607685 RepID=A0ABV8TUG9_9ACTN
MASGKKDVAVVSASPEEGRHEALNGPFDETDLMHIDQALTSAQKYGGGLDFSVYVGDLGDPVRATAEELHSQLSAPVQSVLVAISPAQRQLEIVTGSQARDLIPDRSAALVVFSMEAELGQGKLANAIVTGLRMLADTAANA